MLSPGVQGSMQAHVCFLSTAAVNLQCFVQHLTCSTARGGGWGAGWGSGPAAPVALRPPSTRYARSIVASGGKFGTGAGHAAGRPLPSWRRPPQTTMKGVWPLKTWGSSSGGCSMCRVRRGGRKGGACRAGEPRERCPSWAGGGRAGGLGWRGLSALPQLQGLFMTFSSSTCCRFMHLASPYVQGHRGKTFVVVIPGEVRRSSRLPPACFGCRRSTV